MPGNSTRWDGEWYVIQVGDGVESTVESHPTQAEAERAKGWCEEHEIKRHERMPESMKAQHGQHYTFRVEHRPRSVFGSGE